jgi:hypothetical protein
MTNQLYPCLLLPSTAVQAPESSEKGILFHGVQFAKVTCPGL